MEESAHLIKHSLRAATATMSSSSPEGWSPKLRAVVLGPTPPDAELVWTTWKPDGSPWFEHRCELSELADEETYEAELQHLEDGTDIDDDGDCRFTLRLVMELDGLDELLHDGVVQVRRIGAADDHVFAAGHDWLLSLGLVALDVDDEADAPMLRVTVFLGGDADAFDCEAHCFKDGKRFAKASDISGGYTFTTNDDTVVGVEVIASFEEIRGWNNLTDEGWGESSWHLLDGESGKYEIKFLRSGTVTRIVSFDVVDGRITSADRIEPDASLRPTMWLPAQIEGELDGPQPGLGLAHDLDVIDVSQHQLESPPECGMVVGDEQPGHRSASTSTCSGRCSSGSTARITRPPSGRSVMVQLPPSSAARSRIDVQPTPRPVDPLRASAPRPLSAIVSSNSPFTHRPMRHLVAPA